MFKDNLKNTPLPLDGNEWGKLFDELHPEKKKRFAWWWFVLPALILGSFAVYQLVNDKTGSTNPTAVVMDSTTSQNNESINPNKVANDYLENEEQNIEPNNAKIDENNVVAETPKTKEENTTKPASNSSGVAKPQSKKDLPKQKEEPSKSINNDPVDPTFETENLLEVAAKNNVNFDIKPALVADAFVYQPPFYPTVLSQLIDTLDDKSPKRFMDPYLGLSIGGSQNNQYLSSSDPSYINYRNRNESSTLLPNFGLQIGGTYKGIDLGTGVGYSVNGQATNGKLTYEIYDSIRRIDINGDTSYLPYNYRDTTIDGTSSPRYNYISIPLQFGKTIYQGDKFGLSLGVKTTAKYLLSTSGNVLTTEIKPSVLQQTNGFNHLNFTYGGYATVNYSLNSRLRLVCVVRYDSDAMNMLKNQDAIQRFSGFGSDLSVQFKLK